MKTLAALAFSALLSGCAGFLQVTDWKPALDHMTDRHPERIAKDEYECKVQDAAYVGYGILDTIPALILGAGKFFTFGASPHGHPAWDAETQYRNIYTTCMQNRGHNVLN